MSKGQRATVKSEISDALSKDHHDSVPAGKDAKNQDSAQKQPQTQQQQPQLQQQQPAPVDPNLSAKKDPKAVTGNELQPAAKPVSEKEQLDKLQKQNEKLKREVKELTEALHQVLEKAKEKKPSVPRVKEIVKQSFQSDEEVQKLLENKKFQIQMYQKDIKSIQSKIDGEGSLENYYKLQEVKHTKEQQLSKLQNELKTAEKSIKNKEKELANIHTEVETQSTINYLNEQVRILKERIREIQKKEDFQKDQATKREEFLKKVEQRLDQVIQKTGYHPESDLNRQKSPNISATNLKKSVNDFKSPGKEKPVATQDKSNRSEDDPYTEEKFNEVKKNYQILKRSEKSKKQAFDKESETLQKKIEQYNREAADFDAKSAEKDKEIQLFTIKQKELNKMVRHQTLAPLDNSTDQQVSNGKIPKSPDGGEEKPAQSQYIKGYRRDERGREKKGEEFSDQPTIGEEKTKIYQIKAWYEGDKLLGIQASYIKKDGNTMDGAAHVKDPNAKSVVFKVDPKQDYVKEISGFMDRSGGNIECLIMTSFKGESQKVGQPQKSSKLFKFDINEMEYPACIYGTMREENGVKFISKLGVLIAVDKAIEEKIEPQEGNVTTNSKEKSDKTPRVPERKN